MAGRVSRSTPTTLGGALRIDGLHGFRTHQGSEWWRSPRLTPLSDNLFTKGIRRREAERLISIAGDRRLGAHVLDAVAIVG